MRDKINRKTVAIAAGVLALGAGGAGIAYAVGGDEEQVTGPDASRAEAAALEAVGGGTVTEVEHQDGDGAGVYEVEVQRPDGSQVEVHIGGDFQPLGTAADDDAGAEDDADTDD
jgi:Peptidase propeptide and YPEB domain